MARDARRRERSGVAPGRGKPRTRATSRSTAAGNAHSDQQTPEPQGRALRAVMGGVRFTRRAVAMIVVLALLLFSYVGSFQIYWKQQRDMATYQEQINAHNASIAELQDELARWNDDDYVRAQARTRLGWVVPGETGYIVLGTDGQPVGGASQLGTTSATQSDANMSWWRKLWDSLVTADQSVTQTTNPQTAPISASPSATATKR